MHSPLLVAGERSEPITRMPIKPYDTESQSRNVLASPLGEEDHEVAKGGDVGKNDYDILILCLIAP